MLALGTPSLGLHGSGGRGSASPAPDRRVLLRTLLEGSRTLQQSRSPQHLLELGMVLKVPDLGCPGHSGRRLDHTSPTDHGKATLLSHGFTLGGDDGVTEGGLL